MGLRKVILARVMSPALSLSIARLAHITLFRVGSRKQQLIPALCKLPYRGGGGGPGMCINSHGIGRGNNNLSNAFSTNKMY